eukprot:PhM_4_TR18890/c0_g1_i1/m.20391
MTDVQSCTPIVSPSSKARPAAVTPPRTLSSTPRRRLPSNNYNKQTMTTPQNLKHLEESALEDPSHVTTPTPKTKSTPKAKPNKKKSIQLEGGQTKDDDNNNNNNASGRDRDACMTEPKTSAIRTTTSGILSPPHQRLTPRRKASSNNICSNSNSGNSGNNITAVTSPSHSTTTTIVSSCAPMVPPPPATTMASTSSASPSAIRYLDRDQIYEFYQKHVRYQCTPTYNITKKRPLSSVLSTGYEIYSAVASKMATEDGNEVEKSDEELPTVRIQCIEGTILGMYLSDNNPYLMRFPISFHSEFTTQDAAEAVGRDNDSLQQQQSMSSMLLPPSLDTAQKSTQRAPSTSVPRRTKSTSSTPQHAKPKPDPANSTLSPHPVSSRGRTTATTKETNPPITTYPLSLYDDSVITSPTAYFHIVLGFCDLRTGLFGAFGASRAEGLGCVPCKHASLAELIFTIKASYEAVGHVLISTKIGRPVQHSYVLTSPHSALASGSNGSQEEELDSVGWAQRTFTLMPRGMHSVPTRTEVREFRSDVTRYEQVIKKMIKPVTTPTALRMLPFYTSVWGTPTRPYARRVTATTTAQSQLNDEMSQQQQEGSDAATPPAESPVMHTGSSTPTTPATPTPTHAVTSSSTEPFADVDELLERRRHIGSIVEQFIRARHSCVVVAALSAEHSHRLTIIELEANDRLNLRMDMNAVRVVFTHDVDYVNGAVESSVTYVMHTIEHTRQHRLADLNCFRNAVEDAEQLEQEEDAEQHLAHHMRRAAAAAVMVSSMRVYFRRTLRIGHVCIVTTASSVSLSCGDTEMTSFTMQPIGARRWRVAYFDCRQQHNNNHNNTEQRTNEHSFINSRTFTRRITSGARRHHSSWSPSDAAGQPLLLHFGFEEPQDHSKLCNAAHPPSTTSTITTSLTHMPRPLPLTSTPLSSMHQLAYPSSSRTSTTASIADVRTPLVASIKLFLCTRGGIEVRHMDDYVVRDDADEAAPTTTTTTQRSPSEASSASSSVISVGGGGGGGTLSCLPSLRELVENKIRKKKKRTSSSGGNEDDKDDPNETKATVVDGIHSSHHDTVVFCARDDVTTNPLSATPTSRDENVRNILKELEDENI